MSGPRICFVTTFYPPLHFGGDGIAVQRLARALSAQGLDVTVVHDADAYRALAHRPAAGRCAEEDRGVRVVTLRTRMPLLSTLLTHQTGRPVVNRRRLSDVLAPGAFDVIVFNNVSLVGGPALFAYGGHAAKIYLAHEHWLVCPTHVLWRHRRERCDGRQCLRCQIRHGRPPQWWRLTGLLERHAREIDLFVAMSEFSRRTHRSFGFAPEMRVAPGLLTNPGPVPEASLEARPHDRPYFLVVGRLDRPKGVEEAIEAVLPVEDADLVIAGDGPDGSALRRLTRGSARVRFLGQVDPGRLVTYYRHAVALVAPSIGYETYGLTPVEAFRQRTPAIARRLGPFPETVGESGGGLLFDTTADLTKAMRRLLDRPDERDALGAAGHAAFERLWSDAVLVPKYLELIDEAIARRRARDR